MLRRRAFSLSDEYQKYKATHQRYRQTHKAQTLLASRKWHDEHKDEEKEKIKHWFKRWFGGVP